MKRHCVALLAATLILGVSAPAVLAQEAPSVQEDPLFNRLFPPELIMQHRRAIGLTDGCPVGRYLRDARVTEVIEGSTQIQQVLIAKYPIQEL